MLDKINRLFSRGEAEKMAALKPDEPDKPRTENPDLKTWMGEAKSAGVEGEIGETGVEFTAGELHAKAETKVFRPHLELVRDEQPKVETVNLERQRLLEALAKAEEEAKKALRAVADIRAQLSAVEAKEEDKAA